MQLSRNCQTASIKQYDTGCLDDWILLKELFAQNFRSIYHLVGKTGI